jgi:hypothetical protein
MADLMDTIRLYARRVYNLYYMSDANAPGFVLKVNARPTVKPQEGQSIRVICEVDKQVAPSCHRSRPRLSS